MQNHSNENEFYLHENGPVGETHFHLNGFARRLDVKQRQRVTRKWPISLVLLNQWKCQLYRMKTYLLPEYFTIILRLCTNSLCFSGVYRLK